MDQVKSQLRNNFYKKALTAIILSTATCAPVSFAAQLPYQVEVVNDTVLFHRANTREQDFGGVLTVTGPNDFRYQQSFSPAEAISFSIFQGPLLLVDGAYNYELVVLGPQQPRIVTPTEGDNVKLGTRNVSGVFSVDRGSFISPDVEESSDQRDQVILDDLIVDGSICAGQDCVNGESFGFDTIRLKENNLRIRFQDTSNSASFPTTDWELVANDTSNGGSNRFSIEDLTAGSVPFTVEGAAPSNSLFIDNTGRLGFGTSTPLLDIHVVSGNTPSLRFDQNASQGFPAQTWDLGANESEFFVRDNTAGTVPLRIIPGAPNDSARIDNNGNLGLGTNAPNSELHLRRNNNGPLITFESLGAPNSNWVSGLRDSDGDFTIDDSSTPADELIVRSGGNLEIAGSLVSMRGVDLPKVPEAGLDGRAQVPALKSVEAFIEQNGQLPGISNDASAHDMLQFQMQLLQKIQELTLYTIEQEKRIQQLEQQLSFRAQRQQ